MTQLGRTARVLHRVPMGELADGRLADFAQFEEGDPKLLHTLVSFDLASWADMGSPETITVTVEPGDQLNTGQDQP